MFWDWDCSTIGVKSEDFKQNKEKLFLSSCCNNKSTEAKSIVVQF